MRTFAIGAVVLGLFGGPVTGICWASGGHVEVSVDLKKVADPPCSAIGKQDSKASDVDLKAAVGSDQNALAATSKEVKSLSFFLQLKGAAGPVPLTASASGSLRVLLAGGPSKLEEYEGATVFVKRGGKDFCSAPVKTDAGGSCDDVKKQAMVDARNYIAAGRLGPLITRNSTTSRTIIIPILPDGSRYSGPDPKGGDFKLPDDITERDRLQLVAVVPGNATVAWEAPDPNKKDSTQTTTCTAPPLFRNLTTGGDSDTKDGKKADLTPAKLLDVQPQWHPPFGHGCETALNYVVKVTLAGCDSIVAKDSITTEKVYDFLLGAGFGYDFGTPVDYSSQTKVTGTTTEKVLVRSRDQSGLKPIVTLSYFPFGANPNRWGCRNWLSPFIGLDPTRVDKGGILGVNFQPFGIPFSFLAGVSVYQSEKLNSPVGLKPGDTIPTGSDISTRNVFSSDGVGAFFGANFTTESLKLLFSKGAETFGASK